MALLEIKLFMQERLDIQHSDMAQKVQLFVRFIRSLSPEYDNR
jgi:hypothetical protein